MLNTSFNGHQSIVATPREAPSSHVETRTDVLALGNLVLTRPNA